MSRKEKRSELIANEETLSAFAPMVDNGNDANTPSPTNCVMHEALNFNHQPTPTSGPAVYGGCNPGYYGASTPSYTAPAPPTFDYMSAYHGRPSVVCSVSKLMSIPLGLRITEMKFANHPMLHIGGLYDITMTDFKSTMPAALINETAFLSEMNETTLIFRYIDREGQSKSIKLTIDDLFDTSKYIEINLH